MSDIKLAVSNFACLQIYPENLEGQIAAPCSRYICAQNCVFPFIETDVDENVERLANVAISQNSYYPTRKQPSFAAEATPNTPRV